MRVTVVLDDKMFARAQVYTGLTNKSEVIRHALQAFIHREASRRLAQLGGSEPDLENIPRRRPWDDVDS
jgi:Arc/MetJ family transcription regulator